MCLPCSITNPVPHTPHNSIPKQQSRKILHKPHSNKQNTLWNFIHPKLPKGPQPTVEPAPPPSHHTGQSNDLDPTGPVTTASGGADITQYLYSTPPWVEYKQWSMGGCWCILSIPQLLLGLVQECEHAISTIFGHDSNGCWASAQQCKPIPSSRNVHSMEATSTALHPCTMLQSSLAH